MNRTKRFSTLAYNQKPRNLEIFLQEPGEKIMFVCKHCKNISFLSPNVLDPKPDQTKRKSTTHQQGPIKDISVEHEIELVIQDYTNWEKKPSFENLVAFTEVEGFNEFPICQKCAFFLSRLLKSKVSFFTEKSKNLKSNSITQESEVFLNKTMNEIESQLSPLLEVNASNQIKMKKPDAFKFPLPPIPPHAQSHINQTASTEINTDSKSDCDWGFGSIMLSSTFYLSTCRHYATINGNRLGTNTPDIVSPDEFDRGLYLLIQLLQVIGKVVSSPIPEFNLTTEIHYINNKGISDVFTSQKLKVNKTISSFKEATKLLFKACHRLFWDLCKMNANFSVPNDIDLKTSKISGESYIYDRKSPHTFTYAMKKLVMNLKTIQTKAMECAVYVISRNFEIMSKTKEEENEKDTNEEHQLRHIESQFSITSASALFSQPTDNLSALALSENSILAPSSYEASTAETLSIISTDIMENENKSDDENIIIESIHNDEMSESDSTDHINENNIIERSKEINESDETDKSKVTNENEEENDEKDGEEN